MAEAFSAGCKRHAVQCDVLPVGKKTDADVIWIYGLGPAKPVFESHPEAVRLVGDKGYFSEYCRAKKYLRVSVNAQQPDKHLRRVTHPSDRFDALGIRVRPISARGDYILICGIGPKQCGLQGMQYGQWERETYRKIRAATDRPVFVREKPGNPKIDGVPCLPAMPASAAIRGAWAVVCMTGNIGADSILEGVPVIAEAGPGSVYQHASIADIETVQPLPAETRLQALADIAYWQWTVHEISRGDLWANMKAEGFF